MTTASEIDLPFTINYRNDSKGKHQLHTHSQYEIYYFHGGKCNYLIGDRIHVLKPGDLIIMDGMTLHAPNFSPDESYVRSVVQFDSGYAQQLFQYPNKLDVLLPFRDLRYHRIHLNIEQQQELDDVLARMHMYRQSNDRISLNRLHVAFMDLLLLVYRYFEKAMEEKPDFPSNKESHAQRIISFIEQYFREDIQLMDLEKALHLNRFYLAKIFKEVTGFTIMNYVNQRRINEAKLLFLLNDSISVTEVSYLVGCKHPSHFSRMFKQFVGCTPEQYLRTQKNTKNR